MPFSYQILLCLSFFCSGICLAQNEKGVKKQKVDSNARGETRALVIGISSYEYITPLSFADADANEFASFISENQHWKVKPENLTLLTNEKAKSGEILTALTRLVERSNRGDRIIFFFSGHGDVEVKTRENLGYLLTYNTPKNNYATGAISIDILRKHFDKLVAKGIQLFVVTDACKSGHLAGGASGAKMTAAAFTTLWNNQTKILSAQPDEVSYEGRQWGDGRGVFSFYLVKGLSGFADLNKDSSVTLSELEQYVGLQVSQATNFKQQPVFEGPNKFSMRVSTRNSGEMSRYEKWNSDQQITVLVMKGSDNTLYSSCKEFVQLHELIKNGDLTLATLSKAIAKYRKIASCDEDAFNEARYQLDAALMNDVQKTVNQSLTGKELVTDSSLTEAIQKIDTVFWLNSNYELLYQQHLENLRSYLLVIKATKKEQNWENYFAEENVMLPVIDKAIVSEPDAAYLLFAKGIIYYYSHEFSRDSAIKYFKLAASYSPTWLMPKLLVGMSYDRDEKYDSASAWYTLIDSIDVSFRQFECAKCFYNNQGWVYLNNHQYKEAEQSFLKAVAVDQTDNSSLCGLIMVYKYQHETRKFRATFRRLDSLDQTIRSKLETLEWMLTGKVTTKKEIQRRLTALGQIISEMRKDTSEEVQRIIDADYVYHEYLTAVFMETFGIGGYLNLYGKVVEQAFGSADELKYRIQFIKSAFHAGQWHLYGSLGEKIDLLHMMFGEQFTYDQSRQLELIKVFYLVLDPYAFPKYYEQAEKAKNAQVKQGLELLKKLHDKGYINCSQLEPLRAYLKKIREVQELVKNCF